MAIPAQRVTCCGCCENTILAAVATPRSLDSPSWWRPVTSQSAKGDSRSPLYVRRRNCKSVTRIGPWRSCSGAKWTNSRSSSESRGRTDAVPLALYTQMDAAARTPIVTDEQIEESCNGLLQEVEASTEQERRRLGVARKALAPSKLLRVGVDVDEGELCTLMIGNTAYFYSVLGTFLASLNTFIAEEYLLHHHVSEYHVYDFMKIWKCSQAEANDRVHAFFESDHFNSGILPIPGAYQTLRQLASYCHLVVVTSRQHVIRQPTMDWINQHYDGIFKDVHFGNHFALEGEARSKSEMCRSLGVEVLIDDNPRYAVECAEHGIEVLLFDLHGNYPWSKTVQGPTHPLITRVYDWSEVEQALCALRARLR